MDADKAKRRNYSREYSDAMDDSRRAIQLANDGRYGEKKAGRQEMRNRDGIAQEAISRSLKLGDAKYEDQVQAKKFKDRIQGMKAGGKVRGCGAASRGLTKGKMR